MKHFRTTTIKPDGGTVEDIEDCECPDSKDTSAGENRKIYYRGCQSQASMQQSERRVELETSHRKQSLGLHLGALQRKTNSKNPRLLWKGVGGFRSHSELFFFENHPKIAIHQY